MHKRTFYFTFVKYKQITKVQCKYKFEKVFKKIKIILIVIVIITIVINISIAFEEN